jgi:hypothetical protein
VNFHFNVKPDSEGKDDSPHYGGIGIPDQEMLVFTIAFLFVIAIILFLYIRSQTMNFGYKVRLQLHVALSENRDRS